VVGLHPDFCLEAVGPDRPKEECRTDLLRLGVFGVITMLSGIEEYWRDSFDRSAVEAVEDYAVAQWSEHGFRRRLTQFKILHQKLRSKENNELVLDAGCGSGAYSIYLASTGSRVLALDFSENMVWRASANVLKQPHLVVDLIECVVGNVKSLPARSNRFDLVVCIGVLQSIAEGERVLEDFFRVCKSGAHCVINTLNDRFLAEKRRDWHTRYDPMDLEARSKLVGFECVCKLPMLLFPKPFRFLEKLENLSWLGQSLWPVAHSFTLVLRKP